MKTKVVKICDNCPTAIRMSDRYCSPCQHLLAGRIENYKSDLEMLKQMKRPFIALNGMTYRTPFIFIKKMLAKVIYGVLDFVYENGFWFTMGPLMFIAFEMIVGLASCVVIEAGIHGQQNYKPFGSWHDLIDIVYGDIAIAIVVAIVYVITLIYRWADDNR